MGVTLKTQKGRWAGFILFVFFLSFLWHFGLLILWKMMTNGAFLYERKIVKKKISFPRNNLYTVQGAQKVFSQ